jgi:hypothetical protein
MILNSRISADHRYWARNVSEKRLASLKHCTSERTLFAICDGSLSFFFALLCFGEFFSLAFDYSFRLCDLMSRQSNS